MVLFKHICFDVIKIVYSNVAANTVRRCVISITLFHSYNLFLSQYFCHCLRASDERPYSLVCTNCLHELAAEAIGYKVTSLIIR